MSAIGRTGSGESLRLAVAMANLASEAGEQILSVMAEGTAVRSKQDLSPATLADDLAEEILVEGLGRILPGVPVIAEESVSRQMPAHPRGTYLLVDPVDGTKELIAGRAEYTVNIGLVDGDRPLLGVIYAPSLGIMYVAAEGRARRSEIRPGAKFDLGAAAAIRARPQPANPVALVSRSHADLQGDALLSKLGVTERIPLGSSLKFARIAEGAADLYVRFGPVNEWDIAAGHALLAAAGGTVTAPDGTPLLYSSREEGFRVGSFIARGGPPAG